MDIAYSPTQQVSKDGDQVRSTMAHPPGKISMSFHGDLRNLLLQK